MIPMIHGLRPERAAWTYGFFSSFFSSFTMIRIMMKDGRITASVAISAPMTPPCALPTYVARLIMIGPGVLSLTAIILVSISPSSHPYDTTRSRISGTAAYPPPKANRPTFRKPISRFSSFIRRRLLSFRQSGTQSVRSEPQPASA